MGPMSAEIGEEATVQMTCMAAPSLHKAAWPYPPCTGLHGCAIVLKAVLRSCISSLPIHYTHTLADTHTHTPAKTCARLTHLAGLSGLLKVSYLCSVHAWLVCFAISCMHTHGLLHPHLHAHTWSVLPSTVCTHMVCFAVGHARTRSDLPLIAHAHGLFCHQARTHKRTCTHVAGCTSCLMRAYAVLLDFCLLYLL